MPAIISAQAGKPVPPIGCYWVMPGALDLALNSICKLLIVFNQKLKTKNGRSIDDGTFI
jgi:hypothetical protein